MLGKYFPFLLMNGVLDIRAAWGKGIVAVAHVSRPGRHYSTQLSQATV